MADDPGEEGWSYEGWTLPWRRTALIAVAGWGVLAGVLIGASLIYDATLRPKVQVRMRAYPAPRLEVAHVPIGPRRPADPALLDAAVSAEARAGWTNGR